MAAPFILALVHNFVCSLGTLFYVATVVVILKETPNSLRCYAVTLFSQTLVLMLTCVTSGVHFARVIPHGLSTFVVSSGPAHYIGSVPIGFYFQCFLLHGHSHYCLMLAECFIYRYYVFIRQPPSFRSITITVALLYLPTMLIFCWAASSATLIDEATSRLILAPRGPSYIFDDDVLVIGIRNVLESCNFVAICWVCVLWIPCYAVIIIVGLLVYRTLAATLSHMSERTRALHREIVRGLVVQACLPVLYGVSASMFAIGQYNYRSLVEIEYFTHMAGELCLMFTPLTTLYFVQPYRKQIYLIAIADLLWKTKVSPLMMYISTTNNNMSTMNPVEYDTP